MGSKVPSNKEKRKKKKVKQEQNKGKPNTSPLTTKS